MLSSQVVVSEAQQKTDQWKEEILSLTGLIPAHDAVLQDASGKLELFNTQLLLMAKLRSSTLKPKHLKALFEGWNLYSKT